MNHSMTIDYPDTLPDALHMSRAEFERETLLAAAMKLFETGKLSSSQAADLAQVSQAYFFRVIERSKLSPAQIPPPEPEGRMAIDSTPIPNVAGQRLAALERARRKFGGLLSSSEEFAAAKQAELDNEENRLGR